MLKIHAEVYFKTPEEGNKQGKLISGIWPSFSVSNGLIMSQVFAHADDDYFHPGETYEVVIHLPYGEKFISEIQPGYRFNLNAASQVFADGEVFSILEITE